MRQKTLLISRPTLRAPASEIRSPQQWFNIQRRGARVHLLAGRAAKLHHCDATLIDLSLSGALIEHTQWVRVGDLYSFSFQVKGLHVKIRVRAVRSFVSHRVPEAGGERQLVYRTGVEFTNLTAETARVISAHLNRFLILELAR